MEQDDMNVKTKVVKVGTMPWNVYKKRTIAIAKGEYKKKLDDPKIWFHSAQALHVALSEENPELLKKMIS